MSSVLLNDGRLIVKSLSISFKKFVFPLILVYLWAWIPFLLLDLYHLYHHLYFLIEKKENKEMFYWRPITSVFRVIFTLKIIETLHTTTVEKKHNH